MAENLYEMCRTNRAAGQTEIRAERYSGKQRFLVAHDNYAPLTVFAPTAAAAIWTAGKHWGVSPKKAEFHQGCRVRRC